MRCWLFLKFATIRWRVSDITHIQLVIIVDHCRPCLKLSSVTIIVVVFVEYLALALADIAEVFNELIFQLLLRATAQALLD